MPPISMRTTRAISRICNRGDVSKGALYLQSLNEFQYFVGMTVNVDVVVDFPNCPSFVNDECRTLDPHELPAIAALLDIHAISLESFGYYRHRAQLFILSLHLRFSDSARFV